MAEKEKFIQAAIELEPPNDKLDETVTRENENKMNATFNSLNSSRQSGGKKSLQPQRIGDVCPRCDGLSCLDQINSLR